MSRADGVFHCRERRFRDAAAYVAASLALTCKDFACMARLVNDKMVDQGCARADDLTVKQAMLHRARAATELEAIRALPSKLFNINASDRELREAMHAISLATRKVRCGKGGKGGSLRERFGVMLDHHNARTAALHDIVSMPPPRPVICPVRPHARAVIIALRSGETVKRSSLWPRYRVSAADIALAAVPRKPRRCVMLADVMAILELKARNKVAQQTPDPLVEWERAWAARSNRDRRLAKVHAELALSLPGVAWGDVIRVQHPDIACTFDRFVARGAGSSLLNAMVQRAMGCYARACMLASAMCIVPPTSELERAIWRRFMDRSSDDDSDSDEKEFHATVAQLEEAHFLGCFGGNLDAIGIDAAIAAWLALSPGHCAMADERVPLSLRIRLKRHVSCELAREWLNAIDTPLNGSRLHGAIIEDVVNKLGDEAILTREAFDGNRLVAEFAQRATALHAASQRIDLWVSELSKRHRFTCGAQAVQQAAITVFNDELSTLTATRDCVFDRLEAALGLYRCPMCPRDNQRRFTENGMDAHFRQEHP